MEFGGVLPEDAPDPRVASEARLRAVAFPVFQLRPQPGITRLPITGFTESSGWAGHEELTVEFSYTLWRYPEDRSDPRNEIELDEQTRRSIEEEPPWGRPAWLVEQAQFFRYPMLWSAVRTAWHASPDPERHALAQLLVDHTNDVLRNVYREELGLPAIPTGFPDDGDWRATPTSVAPASLTVDGRDRFGLHIDTDPFVYAFGLRQCRLHDRAAAGQSAVSRPGDHDPPTMRRARADVRASSPGLVGTAVRLCQHRLRRGDR